MAAAMISALSSGCHIHLHNAIKNNREYTDMNEINIKKFLQQTEEYLRQHQQEQRGRVDLQVSPFVIPDDGVAGPGDLRSSDTLHPIAVERSQQLILEGDPGGPEARNLRVGNVVGDCLGSGIERVHGVFDCGHRLVGDRNHVALSLLEREREERRCALP